MTAVYGKELSAYFKNPQGYICLAVYYLLGGQFFLMQLRYVGTNDISGIFANMYVVAALTLPLLTMRLFAEERRQHTDQALFTVIKVAAPVLLISMAVGLIVSIFQAVTSIQEQTLTFVPKILAVFLALIVLGNWMLSEMSGFMISLWSDLGRYVR